MWFWLVEAADDEAAVLLAEALAAARCRRLGELCTGSSLMTEGMLDGGVCSIMLVLVGLRRSGKDPAVMLR